MTISKKVIILSEKVTSPFSNKEASATIEQFKEEFAKKYGLDMYCDFVALMQTDLTETQKHLVITIWDSLLSGNFKYH
jgi:hypothetical protein